MAALKLALVCSLMAASAYGGIVPSEYPIEHVDNHLHHHEPAHAFPLSHHHEVPHQALHHIPQHVHHAVIPAAISTVSFVSLNHHNPVSYSGFTNHGRGHYDPGYAVQFRQDGFDHSQGHHDHYHY